MLGEGVALAIAVSTGLVVVLAGVELVVVGVLPQAPNSVREAMLRLRRTG